MGGGARDWIFMSSNFYCQISRLLLLSVRFLQVLSLATITYPFTTIKPKLFFSRLSKEKQQHENPEFGHAQSEIFKKKPAKKKYISIQQGMKHINFGGKLSFIFSLSFSPGRLACLPSLHCCWLLQIFSLLLQTVQLL